MHRKFVALKVRCLIHRQRGYLREQSREAVDIARQLYMRIYTIYTIQVLNQYIIYKYMFIYIYI